MNRRTLFAIACLLVMQSCKQAAQVKPKSLPFYNTAYFTPDWIEPSSKGYHSIHIIPAFSFVNQDGEVVTEKNFRNKIYVADFFFTSCPGICKQLTNGLAKVQEAYKNDNEVLLLSHSVTPEKDSVPRLKLYAVAHQVSSNKWHLVTGDRKAIYALARQSYFADEDLGEQKNEDDFLHTENVLLIDKKRRIRGVYKGTDAAEINNLINDIKQLEQEPQ